MKWKLICSEAKTCFSIPNIYTVNTYDSYNEALNAMESILRAMGYTDKDHQIYDINDEFREYEDGDTDLRAAGIWVGSYLRRYTISIQSEQSDFFKDMIVSSAKPKFD